MEKYISNFFKTNKKFPGMNPVNLHPEYIHKNVTYFFSNKFDGERKLMFKYYNKVYTLSRKGIYTIVPLVHDQIKQFPSKVVFDVEIVKDNIFMLDFFTKTNLQQPFYIRYQQGINYLKHTIIKPKVFTTTKTKLKKELKKYPDLPTDGIIITETTMKFKPGETQKIMKYKPLLEQTIDFLLKDNKIYIQDFNNQLKLINLPVILHDTLLNNIIIECKPVLLNKELVAWEFTRIRHDKNKPNFIKTYQSIVNTIYHFEEIQKTFEKINLF